SEIHIGDAEVLREEYDREYFVRYTGSQFSSLFSIVLGLFVLSLWVQRRKETMYGYFGLTALLWSFAPMFNFVGEPPISVTLWQTLLLSLDHVVSVLACFFALRYAGWHWPRIERWLWVYAAVSVVIICIEMLRFVDHSWRYTYYPVIFGYLGILGVA